MMKKASEQPYYLDAFKRVAAEMLLEEIIPLIARGTETKEEHRRWAGEIAFAMVSGILVKLAKRYAKDVDKFYEQARWLAKDFALEDLREHPDEHLPERRERWMQKLRTLPTYPARKHSPKTGNMTLNKLQALALYEDAVSFVRQIYSGHRKLSEKEILKMLQEKFPELNGRMNENVPCDEVAADYITLKNIPPETVALSIAAWVAGNDVESFARFSLQGAKRQAAELDKALRIRRKKG